jgi:hypothetical protein
VTATREEDREVHEAKRVSATDPAARAAMLEAEAAALRMRIDELLDELGRRRRRRTLERVVRVAGPPVAVAALLAAGVAVTLAVRQRTRPWYVRAGTVARGTAVRAGRMFRS